jgi:hypothetical protein
LSGQPTYSFWLTIWSLLVMIAYAKLRIYRRRERYLTEEMLTDLHNHDLHSRQAGREAIDKYKCPPSAQMRPLSKIL